MVWRQSYFQQSREIDNASDYFESKAIRPLPIGQVEQLLVSHNLDNGVHTGNWAATCLGYPNKLKDAKSRELYSKREILEAVEFFLSLSFQSAISHIWLSQRTSRDLEARGTTKGGSFNKQ